jgi:hypothetical protein
VLPSGDVTRFTGKGTGIGRGPRAGIGIVGAFTLPEGTLDLASAPTLVLTHLISDGVSDAIGHPLTLFAECCNNAKAAYFETGPGVVPHARVALGARGADGFTLRIDVSQATAEPSDECPDGVAPVWWTVNG